MKYKIILIILYNKLFFKIKIIHYFKWLFVILFKIKYIQPCTMILSLPIRGAYFSFLFRKSYANQSKKHFFIVLFLLYIVWLSSYHEVSKLKYTVVKRFSDGLSCKFSSFYREIGFPEKVIDRGIYLLHGIAPFDPRDEILCFDARDSPTFAIYETFRVLGNSDHGTVGSLYDFFLLSSLYYPFNGRIISCGWKNTSCKNLKTFNYSILIVRIFFPFRGFIG